MTNDERVALVEKASIMVVVAYEELLYATITLADAMLFNDRTVQAAVFPKKAEERGDSKRIGEWVNKQMGCVLDYHLKEQREAKFEAERGKVIEKLAFLTKEERELLGIKDE